jgi:hypothetical protein
VLAVVVIFILPRASNTKVAWVLIIIFVKNVRLNQKMSEFSDALNKQNNLIDKYRLFDKEGCPLIDVKPSLRQALIYYFTELIGYEIINDSLICFNRLLWLNDDHDLIKSQFQRSR